MSSTLQAESTVLTGAGFKTGGRVLSSFNGFEGTQTYFEAQSTPTSGGQFLTLGGTKTGQLDTRTYASFSRFQAGRSYTQWSLAQSALDNQLYTKATAGTAVYTIDPSLDLVSAGGNWQLNTVVPGPANTSSQIVVTEFHADGSGPARLDLVSGEGIAAASLTGKASGAIFSDAELRVNGSVSCEYLTLTSANHAGNASAGTAALVAGVGNVATTASDPSALILVSRVGPAGAAVGTLQVTTKGVANFTVESLDATGAVVAGDLGSFDWIIVNAVY